MKVRITGDTPRLERLIARLEQMATPAFRTDLAEGLGATAVKQVKDEFRESRDPYGRPWAPLKRPSRRRGGASALPLRDTGAMQRGFNAQPAPNGFTISTPAKYAAVHQNGAYIPPHSRLGGGERYADPTTGRFLPGKTRRKLVAIASWKHSTYANGITIPRRQMLPTKADGGIGPIWGSAFVAAARLMIRQRFGIEGG